MSAPVGITPIPELPIKPRKDGARPGRASAYADAFAYLRTQTGQAFQITPEPLKPSSGTSLASRIRAGQLGGIVAGEFDASDDGAGLVYAKHVGPAGIAAHAQAAALRAQKKAARDAAKANGDVTPAIAQTAMAGAPSQDW